MTSIIQPTSNIIDAYNRIKEYIHLTPIMHSTTLNHIVGHEIFFKVEPLQKTGAFKIRGVLNHLLTLKEQNKLPAKISTYSTGNHGIGLAYATKVLGIKARIYLPNNTSLIKQRAATYYGAEVIYTETRLEAEQKAKSDIDCGFYYLHPSDSDTTIAGAGTLCYEALTQLDTKIDAIFASCGGGGLLAGSYLAKELISPASLLIGTEPEAANDAFLSLQKNEIHRLVASPITIADGLRTLAVSERTFNYLKKLDKFYLVNEYQICYWTSWLMHLLKIVCEPSSAINMAGAQSWLKEQSTPKKILVLLSGGNIDTALYQQLVTQDYLLTAIN